MSRYTDLVLVAGHATPGAFASFLAAIETWRFDGHHHAYPLYPVEGMGVAIAMASHNHLPLEPYLAMLRTLPWILLGAPVQLWVREEDDRDAYVPHPLHPLPRALPAPARTQALADLADLLPAPRHGSWRPEEVAPDYFALDDALRRYLTARGYTITGGPAAPPARSPGSP